MIVWGVQTTSFDFPRAGGKRQPVTNSWIATTISRLTARHHPQFRLAHEMIVWGGLGDSFDDLNTGGRYNPSTDSWTETSHQCPSGRESHTAVWTGSETGSEMTVWGGRPMARMLIAAGGYCAATLRHPHLPLRQQLHHFILRHQLTDLLQTRPVQPRP